MRQPRIQTFDLEEYWSGGGWRTARGRSLAEKLVRECERTGLYFIRPRPAWRAIEAANAYLEMCVRYGQQPDEVIKQDDGQRFNYQTGVTPDSTEIPLNHRLVISHLGQGNKPFTQPGTREPDKKFRFMNSIGRPRGGDRYTDIAPRKKDLIVPAAFRKEWLPKTNAYAQAVLACTKLDAEMTAVGYGLPPNFFVDLLDGGEHILAATFSYFDEETLPNEVFAGFHYDFNYKSTHTRPTCGLLRVWTRDGQVIEVEIPLDCFLVQTGKELEWDTGSRVLSGFHEVVAPRNVRQIVAWARKNGQRALRVAAPAFLHLNPAHFLYPRPLPNRPPHSAKVMRVFPKMQVGNYSLAELQAIGLARATPARLRQVKRQLQKYLRFRCAA